MRILHVHDAPHVQGGASRYLRALVPVLAEKGHENAVFSLDEPARGMAAATAAYAYSWPRSALRRRRDFSGLHRPLAQALADFAARQKPDLVHVQNLVPFRRTVFPTLRRLGLPVVMTVHDYTLVDPDPPGRVRRGPFAPLLRTADRQMVRRGQRAVREAVSVFLLPTRALMEAMALQPQQAQLLRLPVDPVPAPPLPGPPLRLFFAGTLYRSKGVDLLLDALARARGPAAGCRLQIAGEGDQGGALRRQAAALGLGGRVEWLGQLGPADMERAYASAALQVLPSRVKENSPLTVLEAGARGRPAVASHAGGVPELLAPPERGWTFAPGDAASLANRLEEIVAAPALVAERGRRMRAWVRSRFDPAAHWKAVEGLYRRLLA